MNRTALMLALTAGISCAAFGYEPQRHNDTFTTNGVTYAQRGGLGAADYVVTQIDDSAIGKVTSVNGMDGDVVIDAKSVGAVANDANYLAVSNAAMGAVTAANAYTDASISETNKDFVAAVVAASPPVELPQKWALANVTNENGKAVGAEDVGALSAFNYANGNDRDALISTNDYSLPNGHRVVYNPSLVYSQNYTALKLDYTRIDGLNGTELYELKNVDGNWIDAGYTHIMLGEISSGFGVEYSNGNDINTSVILRPNSRGYFAVESSVAAAATAATNYTDTAIGAAISNTNPVFSNAVLAVGLNLDTNTVAAINALVEAGEELPIGGAATVGALLLALAAAVAALKRTKADASALRYAMPESVALVAENDAATLVCADRAVTNATIVTGFSTLNLSFPAAVSGYVRDFYLRITVASGESAPAISVPQGITIENAGGAVPVIADGETDAVATTLVWFSETAPGIFTTKSETVKAVA